MNKSRLFRLVFISFAIIELLYVCTFYLLADSGVLLKWVNRAPDRYVISWENISSILPGRVKITALDASIQTPTNQTNIQTTSTTFWLSPLGLLNQQLSLYGTSLSNVTVKSSSLSLVKKTHTQMQEFFPHIKYFTPFIATDTSDVGPAKPGWELYLNYVDIEGRHDLWIGQHRMFATGTGSAMVEKSRYGDLSINEGNIDLQNFELFTTDNAVLTNTALVGSFNFDTFNPRFNNGIKKLQFLDSDIKLAGDLENIDFLNFYLLSGTQQTWKGLSGYGVFEGRLVTNNGDLISPTKLQLDSKLLSLETDKLRLKSSGKLILKPAEDNQNEYGILQFSFASIFLHHLDTGYILAELNNIDFNISGSQAGLATPIKNIGLMAAFSNSHVPNLVAINTFIPANIPITIIDGAGKLEGNIVWKDSVMQGSIKLFAEHTLVHTKSFEIQSNIELLLELAADVNSKNISIAGSKLIFDQTIIKNTEKTTAPWSATLNVEEGNLQLLNSTEQNDLKDKNLFKLAEFTDGLIRVDGEISDIGFINTLLTDDNRLQVRGAGSLDLHLSMKRGSITDGSTIKFSTDNLRATFLDYLAQGRGAIHAEVAHHQSSRTLNLKTSLSSVDVRKKDTEILLMTTPSIIFLVNGKFPDVREPLTNIDISFDIINASIPDITEYNEYFPGEGSFQFLQGSGVLNSSFDLDLKDAHGSIKISAPDVTISFNGNHLQFDLDVDLQLINGNLYESRFDISQSKIHVEDLSDTSVSGYLSGWQASIHMPTGTITWHTPLSLFANTTLQMSSTGPLLELFLGRSDSRSLRWLKGLLSVEDVQGEAELQLTEDSLIINDLNITGEELEVAAKLKLSKSGLLGIIYNRYGRLSTSVSIDGDKKDWHIIRPKHKFLEYPSL